MLYLAIIFCVASSTLHNVSGNSHLDKISHVSKPHWANSYAVKATRISLLSDIVENISAWKSSRSSRVDYNQGAVKLITLIHSNPKIDPVVVEIHPETTEEELNKITCHFANITLPKRFYKPKEILPNISKFKAVGKERYQNGIPVTRFELKTHSGVNFVFLASYDYYWGWTPRQLEAKKYDELRGTLTRHEIWMYFDYRRFGFGDRDVFDIEKLGCNDENSIMHNDDSEHVTNELLFIDPENEDHVNYVFDQFKNKFDRKYAHEQETASRRTIFQENMRLISSVNKQNLSYKLGINQFADWTPEERQATFGILPNKQKQSKLGNVAFPYKDTELGEELDKLPKQYDMRDLGLITSVKNQESCGSCWTFAASAVMEGALARVNGGRVLGLSNQAIIDCAYDGLTEEDGGGCHGGYDYVAYNFMTKHGLPTDMEYGPYKMRDGFCNIRNMTKTYTIQGYASVTKYNPNAMKVAVVNNGPLYIYVHVSYHFALYSGGIFYQTEKQCDPEDPNHAVILVGYGEENVEPYWILKNSYGEHWGEAGYMRISARDNVCGVASNPTYPVL